MSFELSNPDLTLNDKEETEQEERLRASIWYTVGRICEEEELKLNAVTTPSFKTLLGEVIYKQVLTMSTDMELFAKHGRRSTVNADDVKLCARRNDSLYDIIDDMSQNLSPNGP